MQANQSSLQIAKAKSIFESWSLLCNDKTQIPDFYKDYIDDETILGAGDEVNQNRSRDDT